MTIEHYHLRPPVKLDIHRGIEEQHKEIMETHPEARKILPEGEHDLTPEEWMNERKNSSRYNILVRSHGTATLRIIPQYADVTTTEISPDVNTTKTKAGGRIYEIPQDIPGTTIATFRDGAPVVYEIINFRPGRSPKKEDIKK